MGDISGKLITSLINSHKAICLFDSEKYPEISGNPSLMFHLFQRISGRLNFELSFFTFITLRNIYNIIYPY